MSGALIDLGTVEYGAAWQLQKDLVARRAADQTPNTLLLLEHPNVITLGRKTTPENFKPQKVPVFKVERGGDATYHGPGQLVGYPIVKLQDHDVRRHVRTMEESLIAAVGTFGVRGERKEGHPGVWVQGRKLASIGVAVTDWVTFHGFALNVNTDMSYFELIRPCGLDPSSMTSMQMITGKAVNMDEVKRKVVREYSAASGEEYVQQEAARPLPPKR
ncbi:MAG TPA: lipoyl(octanoyl) transferase LipB [Nitrososphaerales archaeon]|nr:lipoyl(octanoyl) transferase LipB [Nitrososphaerales archaeon]